MTESRSYKAYSLPTSPPASSLRIHVILYILHRLIVQPVKVSINQTALFHLIGRGHSYDEEYQTLIR